MRRALAPAAALGLASTLWHGCATDPAERSLRGSWTWQSPDFSGSLDLKRDGRYSMSQERCSAGSCIASDSFGTLHWGWFRDGDRVCIVDSKRETIQRRSDDPAADCSIEIDSSGRHARPKIDGVPATRVRLSRLRVWWGVLFDR